MVSLRPRLPPRAPAGITFRIGTRGLVDGLDTEKEGRNATPAQPLADTNQDTSLTPRNLARPTGLEPVTPRSVVLHDEEDTLP
jgi:hypothetical protein